MAHSVSHVSKADGLFKTQVNCKYGVKQWHSK